MYLKWFIKLWELENWCATHDHFHLFKSKLCIVGPLEGFVTFCDVRDRSHDLRKILDILAAILREAYKLSYLTYCARHGPFNHGFHFLGVYLNTLVTHNKTQEFH